MIRNRLLLIVVCVAAVNLSAQTMPIDVELGFRWTDVSGNDNVYRTQINEDEGLLLRALTLASNDTMGFMDHFRLDVSDAGVGPASSLRLEAGLSNQYAFHLRARRTDNFSALPIFANGQHTYDRTRDVVDADFELLRWSAIKPFVGYSWNRFEGPGTTTWHLGQDEFRLAQDLNDTDRELRLGAGFEAGPWSGQVTQGWRQFRGRETLTLASGATRATAATREEHTDVDTPFTNLYVTGQATSHIRLTGNFARFAADSDTTGSDDATGTFTSFALGRFFSGLTEDATGRAKNTTWRGGARAEVTVNEQVGFSAGLRREHRELDGSALIRTLYLQSITFGGVDPRDVEVILRANNALEREENVIDASVSVHPLTPLTLRAGISQSNVDVTVSPDLSEIVIDGSQGGTLDRRVRTLLLDGSFVRSGLTLGASVQKDRADDPILRTDFLARERYRARAAWKAPRFVRAGLMAEQTQQSNNRPDIDYDATLRQYTADVEVTPVEALTLRASASRFRSDSDILFRHPENFHMDRSVHLERGKSLEGGLSLAWSRLTFDGNLTRFENEGTIPFDLDRSHARVTVQLHTMFGIGAEWARDNYDETLPSGEDFEATRYGVFVMLRR